MTADLFLAEFVWCTMPAWKFPAIGLPTAIGQEIPVAKSLPACHLAEYAPHLPHGAAKFGRRDGATVQLGATPDALPVDGHQDTPGLLDHLINPCGHGVR